MESLGTLETPESPQGQPAPRWRFFLQDCLEKSRVEMVGGLITGVLPNLMLEGLFGTPALTSSTMQKRTGLLREARPGGFQTGGFPTFFGKGSDCVADPFGTVPRRCS